MIFVDELPFPTSVSSSQQGIEILARLLDHPTLISASTRLKSTPERKVPAAADRSPPGKHVFVFQREYATVDPALVQMIGTDEATTCVGLVIRNRVTGMTSVAHLDFEEIVEMGIVQMLSLVVDREMDSKLDVHLIGSFEDAPSEESNDATGSDSPEYQDGYSLPLCAKIIEALQNSRESFHLQTICVLGHNTKRDSYGNPCPIISGFMVDTSSGSITPASFNNRSRCPDEIVRRIRITVSSGDPTWKGKLLETYDTRHDRFQIAPCSWSSNWAQIAYSLQQLSDSDILFQCSTSPFAESPDFVDNDRRFAAETSKMFFKFSLMSFIVFGYIEKCHLVLLCFTNSGISLFEFGLIYSKIFTHSEILQCRKWSYLIKYPDWRQTFSGRKPRIFERTAEGGWIRTG